MDFAQTKALISGGASGLGLATAKHIIAQGGKVALLDINQEQGDAAAKELGDNAIFITTDISQEQQVEAAADKAAEFMGGINLAVGCAGILGAGLIHSKKGPMPADYFQKVVDINLVGSFLLTRAASRHMQENEEVNGERGVIIHTASIAAYEGQVGQTAYSATKSAITGMVLPLAREFARIKVRVMAVAPGVFETPMMEKITPEVCEEIAAGIPNPSRFGKPQEYAELVQHIAENAYLNGTTIRLDAAARLQ
ncbi:SDR family NAD(P)-dependent oxidoreductase [Kangiella shandongensis]|uniref:SDR family NAD(P)-dependent oxidoreductase n=1 Tax=Kangiella shandongensis TaxID=2763258 RepID=UPI001CBCD919|nr:SDR family NAD(P)-dependent oxidoreductase [Kangiella shandongensis]